MSIARPIYKNVSLMLTRRVRQRTLLLRPSKRTNSVVAYVLAVVAARRNIMLHAVTAMSNHWHVCLTDPDGNIVDFQRDCHQFIARALNAHHGEFENVWAAPHAGSRVECEQRHDLIESIAYTMANPVEAGLVRYGKNWPGLRRAWPASPLVIKKPRRFFRGAAHDGTWPDEATLAFAPPPSYDELSDDELAAIVQRAVNERENELRDQFDAEGRRFLGRKNVLAQSRHHRPRNREERFAMSPRVKCKDKWRRIERLKGDKRWRRDYAHARAGWEAGDRDVVFPYGTYLMRVRHGVTCAKPPD